ncbi:hypothetical protein GWI33_018478 [Rhynchophorus ferrugineus]|uniref:Ig-like domain-containing protein n=1 Tax=Rhynchophorus ferrugineus TaxID=354439 RepID=A0A834M2G8_RHYFE|nr:hypothetical protein GWI33_018478 [Rhynchophorus ferrugineus]
MHYDNKANTLNYCYEYNFYRNFSNFNVFIVEPSRGPQTFRHKETFVKQKTKYSKANFDSARHGSRRASQTSFRKQTELTSDELFLFEVEKKSLTCSVRSRCRHFVYLKSFVSSCDSPLKFRDFRISSLKDVVLDINPRVVEYGKESTLRCSYNLENAPLYTVKWYRGQHEFYRFTPKELPNTKIFPFDGMHIDESQSNEHQVVLRKIGFNLSGNFSCEVTTDEPSFSAVTVIKDMLVVGK